jgi:hypothetical protein
VSIETDIKTILDGYSGLTALVSTRIYVVKLPQLPTYPNVVLSYNREIENTLSGESSLEHLIMQVDVRDTSYSSVRSIVIQVKAAMAAATNLTSICITDEDLPYEDGVETYRTALRFSIWQ